MLKFILKKLWMAIILLTANQVIAQSSHNKHNSSDTSLIIRFNWKAENEIRKQELTNYYGANICSRWIKFSDKAFMKLKAYDGKKVIITLQHVFTEGLNSQKSRGVDVDGMQGTSNNVNCNCILVIKPVN